MKSPNPLNPVLRLGPGTETGGWKQRIKGKQVFVMTLLALFAALSFAHADPESPLFGEEIVVHGQTYTWDHATEDNQLQTDHYLCGVATLSVIAHMTNNNNLAVVAGDGGINGYLQNGTFHDSTVATTSYPNQQQGGMTYTWTSGQTIYDVDTTEWVLRSSGTEHFTGNGGSAAYSWSDNGNWVWDYSAGGTTTTPSSGQPTLELFGTTYTFTNGTWSASYNYSYDAATETESELSSTSTTTDFYESADQGSAEWVLEDPSQSQMLTGWDPYIGSFSFDGSTYTFGERGAPSFAPSQLWVSGTLVNWIGGSVSEYGIVTDEYSDENNSRSLTIDGNLREFTLDDEDASVTIDGVTNGTLSSEGVFTVSGYEVLTTDPNRDTPLFVGTDVWVNGTQCSFTGGYEDASGNRTDTYTNESSGGSVGMIGNVGETSQAVVQVQYNGQPYSGTFENGQFTVAGLVISTVQPLTIADAFWCAGQYYSRIQYTNDYVALGGSSMTFSASEGSDVEVSMTRGAVTYTGTYDPAQLGAFALSHESSIVPACPANADETGSLQLAAGGRPEEFPPAIAIGNQIWKFIGVATAEGTAGLTAGYYTDAANSKMCVSALRIHVGVPATVKLTDYSSSVTTTGLYHLDSHLFQTGASNGLPNPLLGVDSNANNVLWGLLDPNDENHPDDPDDVPFTFVVWGEVWRYAGQDQNGNAVYLGYHTGQQMLLSRPGSDGNRQVTLVDPNRGVNTQGTLNDLRGSVRMRNGTMVYSGNYEGEREVVTAPSPNLYTIGADLDFTGNVLSFGSLADDAGTAGVILQFVDDAGTQTSTLASALGRPNARWEWYRAGSGAGTPALMMDLDNLNRLKLHNPANPSEIGVTLNPNGVSEFKGSVTVDGVLIISNPAGGISMGEFE